MAYCYARTRGGPLRGRTLHRNGAVPAFIGAINERLERSERP